jgi:nicotinamidase-related amidase
MSTHPTEDSYPQEYPIMIGNPDNFWLWTKDGDFDLNHPTDITTDPAPPYVRLETNNNPIIINTDKTALVIINMINKSLSRPSKPRRPVHDVEDFLIARAIPAVRKAGIQVIWLNRGLSAEGLAASSPTVSRIWSFGVDNNYQPDKGIGSDMGSLPIEDGSTAQAGRFLIKGDCSAQLHAPLERLRRESLDSSRPDALFYKVHIPAMCGGDSEFEDFLREKGITTLLFGGANTEYCVLGSLIAANMKDFDTIMLSDATGTINGEGAMRERLRLSKEGWGFLSSVEALEKGLPYMVR